MQASAIEMDRDLYLAIICFFMDIAIEGFLNFKVVNWVGIPMLGSNKLIIRAFASTSNSTSNQITWLVNGFN
jgi:hypothetical protein